MTAPKLKGRQVIPSPINAFAGKTDPPDSRDLASALRSAQTLWDRLVDDLRKQEVSTQEWGSSSPKTGWSLRLKRKDRIILYLIPLQGSFQAALVLGDKAMRVARESGLSESVLKNLAEARRYAEGTGIRILVKGREDVAAVEKLAFIKVEN